MRPVLVTSLLAAAFLPDAPPPPPPPSQNAEVLATLERFQDALRAKDSVAMRAELHDLARFTLLRPPDVAAEVTVFDAPSFVAAVMAPDVPVLDEVMRNPQVSVDADLATVWVEYQVRINGSVSHCGYNAFHLVRQRGTWKVLNVSDTARQQGCGAKW
jgi:hypothetical protein